MIPGVNSDDRFYIHFLVNLEFQPLTMVLKSCAQTPESQISYTIPATKLYIRSTICVSTMTNSVELT